MKVRFLPADEWARLAPSPLGLVSEQMSPDTAEVLVVEDEAGRIIGTWSDQLMLHLEGFWVAPDHRDKAAVSKLLLRGMFDHLREAGVKAALTHATGPKVDSILRRLGGVPIDGTAFTLPVPEEY